MQKCGQNIENIEISGLKNDRNNQGFVRNINTHISTICSNVGWWLWGLESQFNLNSPWRNLELI